MNKRTIASLCLAGLVLAGCGPNKDAPPPFDPTSVRFVYTSHDYTGYANYTVSVSGKEYLVSAGAVEALKVATKKLGPNDFLTVCQLVPHDGGGYKMGSDCQHY